MDKQAVMKWLKTCIVAGLGAGIASMVAALSDPTKYRFPQDLGSGKMWPYFLSGAAMTIGALLIKSPFGQQALTTFKESQTQLKESQGLIEETKTEIKASVTPAPAGPPPTGPPVPAPPAGSPSDPAKKI
jgi:hypothetical protein